MPLYRDACDTCIHNNNDVDYLRQRKEIRGVVEYDAFSMPIHEWLAYIVERPWESIPHELEHYLEDLLACQVTHVDHYRSEKWDSTHEIIVAHLNSGEDLDQRSIRLERAKLVRDSQDGCYVTICEDHHEFHNYTLVQSFTVPVDGSFNILHCVSLAESVSRLIEPYSCQPWTSMWWASIFFHCAREMCGATNIRRGLAFSRRGCLGSLQVVSDECRIRVFDTSSESKVDKAVARMTMGTLKQKLFSVWSGFLTMSGFDAGSRPQAQTDELKMAFYEDQARIRQTKLEDPPMGQVLAVQVEILREMTAKLEELNSIDLNKGDWAQGARHQIDRLRRSYYGSLYFASSSHGHRHIGRVRRGTKVHSCLW